MKTSKSISFTRAQAEAVIRGLEQYVNQLKKPTEMQEIVLVSKVICKLGANFKI